MVKNKPLGIKRKLFSTNCGYTLPHPHLPQDSSTFTETKTLAQLNANIQQSTLQEFPKPWVLNGREKKKKGKYLF